MFSPAEIHEREMKLNADVEYRKAAIKPAIEFFKTNCVREKRQMIVPIKKVKTIK